MTTNLLPGRWPELPPKWYVSVNAGASAFSVYGRTKQQAVAAAAAKLWDGIVALNPDVDPFELDSLLTIECERLTVYTEQDWTAHCVALHRADQLAKRAARRTQVPA